jgi:drug/metabolite transporter (DMT)-like permease
VSFLKEIFNFGLLLMMLGYALFNGTSSYFLKIGINRVTGIELSIKGMFRNPIKTIYRFLRIPVVILGIVLSVIGFLIYLYALSIYLMSDVKPLTNLSLIIVFLLGVFILKERISKKELAGIVTMSLGAIFISMFATEKVESLPQVNIPNTITFSIICCIISICFIVMTFIKHNKKIQEYFLAISSGILFGIGVIFTNALLTNPQYTISYLISNPFLYLFALSYLIAIFIEAVAFSSGRLIYIGPIISILTIAVPVLGASIIFNEELLILFDGALIFPLSFLKLIGITLIIIGTLIIYPKFGKLNPADETDTTIKEKV